MIKYILLFTLLITSFQSVKAQQNNLQWLDLELANYQYPYPVLFITVNTQQQQLKMAYMDILPEEENGQTVVLLHGKNFNGAYWKTTADALSANGYRVIVPDQIGFGKSSKPHHFQYTFQQLAANTKALLDSLNVPDAVVVGHSMGGMLAVRFALMYPEVTRKLVLVNPIGLEDWKLKVPYKPVEWWYRNELKSNYESIKQYQKASYYDNQWKPEYDEWVNLLAGWTINSGYKVIAWNAALTYDMIFTQPVVYEFGNITSPTLLIIGTRDRTALGKPLVPEDVRETMGRYDKLGKQALQQIPGAQLVELDDIGHMPHIEAFGKFIDTLIEFLNKQ